MSISPGRVNLPGTVKENHKFDEAPNACRARYIPTLSASVWEWFSSWINDYGGFKAWDLHECFISSDSFPLFIWCSTGAERLCAQSTKSAAPASPGQLLVKLCPNLSAQLQSIQICGLMLRPPGDPPPADARWLFQKNTCSGLSGNLETGLGARMHAQHKLLRTVDSRFSEKGLSGR